MKIKLIIINWIFALVPLTYVGDRPEIAALAVGYLGFASWLLNKNAKAVEKEIKRFENWITKLSTR